MLSMILTLSVLFPGVSEAMIVGVLVAGSVLAILVSIGVKLAEAMAPRSHPESGAAAARTFDGERHSWRMPPLDHLPPARLTLLDRVWLIVLRAYLVVAAGLVLIRIVMLATAGT